MKKTVYLGLSILQISKIVMFGFWHDNVKPIWAKAKLCYMNTEGFTVYMKIEDIYVGIARDIYTRFDT